MWSSNWTKGLTDALEKTGEAIQQAEKKATKGLTDALEKTGEAITQAATKAKPKHEGSGESQVAPSNDVDSKATAEETLTTKDPTVPGNTVPMQQMQMQMPKLNESGTKVLKNLQMGWSSVVETTKRTVEATKEVVETERSRLEQNFLRKGFYKRDPKLPLDVQALKDAQVVYITDRILTMSHPAMASQSNPNITAQRKLAAVGHLLDRRHDGRYLVWNLSEVEYDSSVLNDQVLTFSFPGSPSPPLGLLLKLIVSMENWMKADDRNVAVVHCLTGKGRTSTVLAAFLCWIGEASFSDIHQALEYIAKCKQMSVEELIIPSQRRYASYFKNMLDGVRPSQPPLLLKRIIMSEAPKFAKGPDRETVQLEGDDTATPADNDDKMMGCAPYLQIFKAGKLIFTTAATLNVQQAEEELPFVQVMDGTVPFHIEQVIQGDILIRCRHLTFHKQRVSMFRAAFHTGYAPPNVLRLTKPQLDGACSDQRYSNDFFLDLIFEKVDTETATKHLGEEQAAEDKDDAKIQSEKDTKNSPVVKASSYDAMLQGDSRFWSVIANRRQEQSQNQMKEDPMWGPIVGRRRGDGKLKKGGSDKVGDKQNQPQRTALETFSIGNEYDFLPEPETSTSSSLVETEKDSLMEALDALDQDETDTEEVVFDTGSVATTEPSKLAGGSGFASNESGADATAAATPTQAAPGTADDEVASKEPTTAPSSAGDDDNEDMDALLAAADEDLGDMNLDDFDLDDDLDDLEAMLKT